MRLRSIALALLFGATASSAQRSPAAIFLTWDGNPTTTVSVDWHLAAGIDIEAVEIRGPGIPRWTARPGAKFQFPHSTRSVRRARITDLRPGATYELRVGASRVYSYRTMPARLTRPVRFATGGDTQADDARFGSVNRYVAKQDVDFVLLGGDLAYSNGDPRLVAREEMWFETVSRTLVTPQGRLIPVIAAIGNHEVFSDRDTTADTQAMIAKTGAKLGDATYYRPLHAHARDRQYQVIDVGDYLSLVLLNTAHTAAIAGEQTAWLRDVLAARPTVPHVFPIYHVPGYPSVRAFGATNSTEVRENWSPLFERAGVRVAFENHDHAYKRTYPIRAGRKDSTGIVYLGDGAWGAGPREIGRDHKEVAEWYLEKTASVNHGIIVTLDQAAARIEVRDTTGAMVDTLRVLKRQAAAVTPRQAQQDSATRRWLAGDHHIHSRYSVGWNDSTTPPTPVIAGDARYPIPTNAEMAKKHGLSWMVSTDHGGPNHSKINLEQAYPELVRSRTEVPGIVQFYGMEFDTPGADHSSLIVPHSHHEHTTLNEIERRFSSRDAFPRDSARDTEPRMLDALRHMRDVPEPPILIANHPSRSATGIGVYGLDAPREFRDWNDTAPRVAVGMEGAPGHQASAINRDGSLDTAGARGGYSRQPTMGGFDQMTARVGGFWDSMLGEGRRWWVTSTSDSHSNWRDGGSDFWPGEYSKTYVHAAQTYDDILSGMRSGRVFVTTGDLVSELWVTAETIGAKAAQASIGGALAVPAGRDVRVTIRVRDPQAANHHGDSPTVARVDLIVGEVTGPVTDRTQDTNATTRVARRFGASNWKRDGEWLTMTHTLRGVHHTSYVRVRGTNTTEAEPAIDPRGENPWADLWFYSNPIFLEIR